MKKLPTVKIQGKDYVMVKERVIAFNELYPEGEIQTEILTPFDSPNIIVRATVLNKGRKFVAHSQATIGEGYINKTAALENAETSAVGRALAFMGIGVIESVASADEIHKVKRPEIDLEAKEYTCHGCGNPIDEAVKKYSLSKFNKQLCRGCQMLEH